MHRAFVVVALLISHVLLPAASAFAQSCATLRYGWTHTFGAENEDIAYSVESGEDGVIYFTGMFQERVDFDPSPKRTDWRESNGRGDGFFSLFDSEGRRIWTGTMGGLDDDFCYAVHTSNDRFYLGGAIQGPVDLNPRKKEDIHSGWSTQGDAYLTCMGTDRRYQWSRIIPSTLFSYLRGGIRTDSKGNVISTGYWQGTADFDPGEGEDLRPSDVIDDVFVWKLSPRGNYQWTHTIGGSFVDIALGLALDPEDNVYVAGFWSTEVDFDPRGKHDVRKVEGSLWDIFLTKLSPKGKVEWTWTVGSTTEDESRSVAIGPDGRVYVAGVVTGTADFDARGKGDVRQLQGAGDGFLTSFTPRGKYLGTHVYPGVNGQGAANPWAMDIDGPRGLIAIGGSYSGTVDFDPGPGQELRTSKGSWDCFVLLLTLEGEYVDALTFGGADKQEALWGLDFDNNGNLLLTGWFQSATVDFNACEGGDVRTRVGDSSTDIFLTKYIRLTQ